MTAAAVETAATRVAAAVAAAVGVAAAEAGIRSSKFFLKETKAEKCQKVNFNVIVSYSYHDAFESVPENNFSMNCFYSDGETSRSKKKLRILILL
jgi:hypothetical protein